MLPFDFNLTEFLGNEDLTAAIQAFRDSGDVSNMGAVGLNDINKFRVNPNKGFFAEDGMLVKEGPSGPPTKGPGSPTPFTAKDIIEDLGMDRETFKKYRDLTAYHETGGEMDPTMKQTGGGPARGLFQFEPDALETAGKRLSSYYKSKKMAVPSDVERAASGQIKNAAELSTISQELFLVGGMMQRDDKGNVKLAKPFRKELNTIEDFADAWFEGHNKSGVGARRDKFIKDAKNVFSKAGNLLDIETSPPVPFVKQEQPQVDPGTVMAQSMLPSMVPQNKFGGINYLQMPTQMPNGGNPEKAFLGKLVKGAGKFFGKVGKGLWEGAKGSADFMLGNLGMPDVIQDTFVDRSKFLSGANNVIGGIARTGLSALAPGLGSAVNQFGSNVNNAVNMSRMDDQYMGTPGFAGNQGLGGLAGMFGGLEGLDQGGLMNLLGLLSAIQGNESGGFRNGGIPRTYSNGGKVVETQGPLTGIQTEKVKNTPEYIALPDNHIVKVNAKTTHEKMDDSEVTDVVPQNSYIASAQKDMMFTRDELEGFEFGYEDVVYRVGETGKPPKMLTAADILPKGKNKILPAEYAKLIDKTFPLTGRDDQFSEAADNSNLAERGKYIQAMISLGEVKRQEKEGPDQFKYGGIPKASLGELVKGASNVLAGGGNFDEGLIKAVQGIGGLSAAPSGGGIMGILSMLQNSKEFPNGGIPKAQDGFLANLFNRSTTGTGINPVAAGLSGLGFLGSSIASGINERSQRKALERAQEQLAQLTAQQTQLNQGRTGIGVLNALAQETDLPEVNMDFSRLENFDSRTPQQFINAQARPTFDTSALIDRLGARAASTAMANQQANIMNARNQAAMQAFNQDRNTRFGIAQAVTQGRNQEEQLNNRIRQQEVANRNAAMSAASDAFQGGMSNQSRILTNDFNNRTRLDVDQARLRGQALNSISQNAMNMGGMFQMYSNRPAPPQSPYINPNLGQGLPDWQSPIYANSPALTSTTTSNTPSLLEYNSNLAQNQYGAGATGFGRNSIYSGLSNSFGNPPPPGVMPTDYFGLRNSLFGGGDPNRRGVLPISPLPASPQAFMPFNLPQAELRYDFSSLRPEAIGPYPTSFLPQ